MLLPGLKKSRKNGGMPPEVFVGLAEVFEKLIFLILSGELFDQIDQKSSNEQKEHRTNNIPLNIQEITYFLYSPAKNDQKLC